MYYTDFVILTSNALNSLRVLQYSTCDIGGQPAAGFLSCQTCGDALRCCQNLQEALFREFGVLSMERSDPT